MTARRPSFELLARKALRRLPDFFEVKRYRVTVERRKNKRDETISLSEAVVVIKLDGVKRMSVSDSMESGSDAGPVNALSKALTKDLGRYQERIADMALVDFRVRIMQGGTEGRDPRHHRSRGRRWPPLVHSRRLGQISSMPVSEALLDAIRWKLCAEGAAA